MAKGEDSLSEALGSQRSGMKVLGERKLALEWLADQCETETVVCGGCAVSGFLSSVLGASRGVGRVDYSRTYVFGHEFAADYGSAFRCEAWESGWDWRVHS